MGKVFQQKMPGQLDLHMQKKIKIRAVAEGGGDLQQSAAGPAPGRAALRDTSPRDRRLHTLHSGWITDALLGTAP